VNKRVSAIVVALFFTAFLYGPLVHPQGRTRTDTHPTPVQTTCQRTLSEKIEYPYHNQPPVGPLPETLHPSRFAANKNAFVAYSIAARIRELLYQEPCYCLCSKLKGHESLLDCFTSDHGSVCHMCQIEALFVYEQSKAHRNPAEIRQAMDANEVWKLDLNQYVEDHYKEYRTTAP
jgi:hypothetical protein